MNKIIYLTILFYMASCQNPNDSKKIKELEDKVNILQKEKTAEKPKLIKEEIAKPQIEIREKNKTSSLKTKFCFVSIYADEPYRENRELYGGSSYEMVSHDTYYTSDVVEIPNYTEDEEYKMMDEFEKKLKRSYEHNRISNMGDIKIKLRTNHCFDSYKEASKLKQKLDP